MFIGHPYRPLYDSPISSGGRGRTSILHPLQRRGTLPIRLRLNIISTTTSICQLIYDILYPYTPRIPMLFLSVYRR